MLVSGRVPTIFVKTQPIFQESGAMSEDTYQRLSGRLHVMCTKGGKGTRGASRVGQGTPKQGRIRCSDENDTSVFEDMYIHFKQEPLNSRGNGHIFSNLKESGFLSGYFEVYGCKRQGFPLQHQDCNHLNVDVVYFFHGPPLTGTFLVLGNRLYLTTTNSSLTLRKESSSKSQFFKGELLFYR